MKDIALIAFVGLMIVASLVHVYDMLTYELELRKLHKAVKQAGDAHDQERSRQARD